MMNKETLKVAIVHDWLPLIGGAERVLEQILKIYPDAHVYTLFNFLSDEDLKSLGIKNITVSYLNRLPGVKKYYRKLLSFLPMAIEDFDLYDYDLVISSSHVVAKGVITGAHQTHVSYVHSPARYAWDLTHQYLTQSNLQKGIKGYLAKRMLSHFRVWDYRTANGVDHFIANSGYIKRRVWKVYRRAADVVYPPVDIESFNLCAEKEDFYLTASRMVPYKRMDLIAEAFAGLPGKKLVIIGDGPEMDKIRSFADKAKNIEIMGYQKTEVLRDYMRRAKAFIFAAEEDFGIIPVEAQACGTPVIAYGAGGALETVIDYEQDSKNGTGLFFEDQTAESLRDSVKRFEDIENQIPPANCRRNAESFAPAIFRKKVRAIVDLALENKSGNPPEILNTIGQNEAA